MKNNSFDPMFWFVALLMSVSMYFAFIFAPTESTMGDLQRIFYFHVPSAWVAFLSFGVTCYGSIMFLAKKDLKYDRVAYCAAEIGVVFCTITLITGSIWAKPAWGVWWAWDARLTSSLVLWLIYLSYLMLRSYIDEPSKRAYLSSVVGIIGFLDVPIVYFSIQWWRTQHPSPVLTGGGGLDPDMLTAFFVCLTSFNVFYFYILSKKINIEKAKDDIEYLFKELDES